MAYIVGIGMGSRRRRHKIRDVRIRGGKPKRQGDRCNNWVFEMLAATFLYLAFLAVLAGISCLIL